MEDEFWERPEYDKLKKLYNTGLPEIDEYWFKLLFNWRWCRGNTGLTLPMVSGLSGVNAWTIFDKMRDGRYGSWHISYCYDIRAPVIALQMRARDAQNVYSYYRNLGTFMCSIGNIYFCPSIRDGIRDMDPNLPATAPKEELTEAWVKQAERLVKEGTFSRRGGTWQVPTTKELEIVEVVAKSDYWTTEAVRIALQ